MYSRRPVNPERRRKQFTGILQADAYAGYNRLYLPDRKPGPVTEALCWSHARRKFFVLADIAANAQRGKTAPPISPIASEAVKRIDLVFDIERVINGTGRREASRYQDRKGRGATWALLSGESPGSSPAPSAALIARPPCMR